MAEDSSFFNIVVVGEMNPRIHHPAWYRHVGLISAEEAELAYKSDGTFTLPPQAHITLSAIGIDCQMNRWEIGTSDEGQVNRIREITCKVFDELLKHTTVTVVGYNVNFVKHVHHDHVSRLLGAQLTSLPLGLPNKEGIQGELVLKHSSDNRTTIVRVAGRTDSVSVSSNFEYRIDNSVTQSFDLRPIFERQYESDRREAVDQTSSVLQAIQRLAPTTHAGSRSAT
jgi:hypothetical protein